MKRIISILFVLIAFASFAQVIKGSKFSSDYDPIEQYPEYSGAALTQGTATVASSIDAGTVTNILITYTYPTGKTNLPILVGLPGYHDSSTSIDVDPSADNKGRWARKGYFLIYVDTRGLNGVGGSNDSGGRETHDIYDAIQYVRTNFSSQVSATKVSVFGFSGGGARTYLMASRYPDLFQCATVYFGMSNWGGDAIYGWYEDQLSRRTQLDTDIGGSPTAKPDEYLARLSKSAIQNFTGVLCIFHDFDDTSVKISQGQQVVATYTAASRTNIASASSTATYNTNGVVGYYYSESNSGSTYRWLHDYPKTTNVLIQAEPYWLDYPKTKRVKTIALSGTLKVIGALYTKRFKVELHDGTSTNIEKSRAATLVYNVAGNSYIITNDSPHSLTAIVTTIPGGATATATINAGNSATLTPL